MDENLWFLLSLAIIVATAFVVLFLAHHKAQQQNRRERACYRVLAKRLRGVYDAEGDFAGAPPAVRFAHGNYRGRVETMDGTHLHVLVSIDCPRADVRCEVYPPQIVPRSANLLGLLDFEIGDSQFDRDFIISGNDPQRVKQLLTDHIRKILHQIHERSAEGDMYFAVNGGKLLLRQRWTDNVLQLEGYVGYAMALHDAICVADQIIFLAEVAASDKPQPVATCQVCGEQISADPVLCKSCRTPHHHDCWEYYGKCSTFGCGERACFRPRRQAKAKGRK